MFHELGCATVQDLNQDPRRICFVHVFWTKNIRDGAAMKQITNQVHLFGTAFHEGSQELVIEVVTAGTLRHATHFTIGLVPVAILTGAISQDLLEIRLITVRHASQDGICEFGRLDEVVSEIWWNADTHVAGAVRIVADPFAIRVVFVNVGGIGV